jgi:hypothetical protein
MGKMGSQFAAELRQVPCMLGKLLGGMLAVGGFTTAVVVLSRRPGASAGDVLWPVLLGILGIVVFVLASRRMAKRLADAPSEPASAGDRARRSLLSWALLLLLAALLVLSSFLIGG